ncbi:MAG TPA: cupin domain-containing protein [Gaiellaceae bacterium]|nr:cupin domain-containing protein [Gaiellaceae bacterium]
MSSDPARQANLTAITCEPRPQLPDGFRRNSTRVGAQFGAARTGLSVYELPPGQAIGPYHYEDPDEEWLLVVSGTPTLRHPGGEDQLEPWDVVFFPSGPAGAHLVRNNGDATARVAMFSSAGAAVGAVVYPDTDMVWVWSEDEAVDLVVKRSSAEDDLAPWTTGEGEADAEH